MSDAEFKLVIPKLREGLYEEWSTMTEASLIAQDLWCVVGPEEPELVAKGP